MTYLCNRQKQFTTPRVSSLSHGRKRWWGELWKIVSLSKAPTLSSVPAARLFRWLKTHVESRNLSIYIVPHSWVEWGKPEGNKLKIFHPHHSHVTYAAFYGAVRPTTKATQIPHALSLVAACFLYGVTNVKLGMSAHSQRRIIRPTKAFVMNEFAQSEEWMWD